MMEFVGMSELLRKERRVFRFCDESISWYPELLDISPYGREQDNEWNRKVTAIVIPNPKLSPIQQEIIADDYEMDNGKLYITQRIPLMHYALERLQVSYNEEHYENPLQYPLVLENRKELVNQGCHFKLMSDKVICTS